MARRALQLAALLSSIGAASAAPIPLAAGPAAQTSSSTTVSARAGVAGLARPGRWLPVRVDLQAGPDGVRDTLRIEWGDAVVYRDVNVPPNSAAHFTILIRAIAASPVVHVTLPPVSTDIPVSLVSADEPLTLCINETRAECTASVSDTDAPTSARGFDLADAVVWPTASASNFHEARSALATWHAWHRWNDSGSPDPVLASIDARSTIPSRFTLWLAGSAILAALVAVIAIGRRWPWPVVVFAPVLVSVGAAWGAGQSGRDANAVVTTAGVVHQFEGVTRGVISLRGTIQHAQQGELLLAPALDDATLNASATGTPRSVSRENGEGRAIYRASAGLGATRRFVLDGTIEATWLEIRRTATSVTLHNAAPFDLLACEWRGVDIVALGTLAPGRDTTVSLSGPPAAGDTVACGLPAQWLRWTAGLTRVEPLGHEFLLVHIGPDSLLQVPDAAR